ncbi:hypothetical protein [Mesorhizobium sp.]|uniref:hypothetical protein n=1 Tax=Mesorhizobium sp. TaxID=1871066 RepID=UPI000FE614B1|nr:hypothetical protein [Mesorhizobium sp.]RWE85120.1 MAG: hypothetical protein EOS49_18495 [Mesorhizobium sp.]
MDIAIRYWKNRGLNEVADTGDAKSLRRRLNGGYYGLTQASVWYIKAKAAFGPRVVGGDLGDSSPGSQVLSEEEQVISEGLQAKGYLQTEYASRKETWDAIELYLKERGIALGKGSNNDPNEESGTRVEDLIYGISEDQNIVEDGVLEGAR